MGSVLSISTIVIPAVTGIAGDLNPDEMLHMTNDEVSWLGKDYLLISTRYEWNNIGRCANQLLIKLSIGSIKFFCSKYWIHRATNWQFDISIFGRCNWSQMGHGDHKHCSSDCLAFAAECNITTCSIHWIRFAWNQFRSNELSKCVRQWNMVTINSIMQ